MLVARREPLNAIEFLGLPGSGKTTIARELVDLLRDQGVTVRFSREVMGDDLPLWRRTPQRLALVGNVIARGPSKIFRATRNLTPEQRRGKHAAKSWWNFLSVLAMHSSQDDRSLLVADQGVAQGIWSARVHHGQNAAPLNIVSEQFEQWIERTLFIHVDASPEVARERLARRAERTSRFQHLNCIENMAMWTRGQDAVGAIVHDINVELKARRLPQEVVSIPNCGEIAAVDRARDVLGRFLKIAESWDSKASPSCLALGSAHCT
jgi:predicted kinase